ncbi:MAG: serine hydrolase [Actinocatenispora sp.]
MLDSLAADLLDHHPLAGPTGVLLRVADRVGTLAESCCGYRQTHRSHDGETRELPDPPRLTPDALFDLASVTKIAATTGALLSLTDRRVLDPDDPARRWLPGMPAGTRLSDLLRHRAGLAEWWPVYCALAAPAQDAGAAETPVGAGGRESAGADAESAIVGLPPRYPRDAGRHYSDLGFMLLGRVVERAAAQPLAAAVAALVHEPAGMITAHYRPAGTGPDHPIVATAHGDWYERRMLATDEPYPVGVSPDSFAGWRTHTLVGEVHDGNAWHAYGGVAGHAGLFGTADDLVAFGRALLASLAGDGPWRAETVRRFVAAGPDAGQGLGFWRWPGHGALGHAGFTGIRFAVLPAVDRVAVMLTNRVHTVRRELVDLGPAWDRMLSSVAKGELG